MTNATRHEILGVTPEHITEPVSRLLRRLPADSEPVYVDVIPDSTADSDECFMNCDRAVRSRGGEVVHGWAIWLSAVIVEAEFHAVWRTPAGQLVDVTPKNNGSDRVMFVADSLTKYAGRQIESVRLPVYPTDALAAAFIRTCEREFAILNNGDRADQYGDIAISRAEKAILDQKCELLQKLASRRVGPQYPCVCGRGGKKMKNCCNKRR